MSINVQCPHCSHVSAAPQFGLYTCPQCGQAMTIPAPTPPLPPSAGYAPQSQNVARIQTKGEMIGPGCFVQGLGLLALIWFPIGTIAALPLIIWGTRLAYHTVCSNCQNRLTDKSVRMCPVCHFTLIK